MIQRIQTLYLLVTTALMAVTLFAPLAWFAGDAGQFGLYAFSLRSATGEVVQPTFYMGIVLALACVLPLITIFLFRPAKAPTPRRKGAPGAFGGETEKS